MAPPAAARRREEEIAEIDAEVVVEVVVEVAMLLMLLEVVACEHADGPARAADHDEVAESQSCKQPVCSLQWPLGLDDCGGAVHDLLDCC